MPDPIRILMQTTIPFEADNWHIGRFSLLREHLASLKDDNGNPLYDIVARDREADAAGNEPALAELDKSDFSELWLFAIDLGEGLTIQDCEGITRFRQRGGGILATRDHQDLGSSLCTLGGIGRAHFFHTKHQEPEPSRQARDDFNTSISWPNYHSGANGDYQTITAQSAHELLRNPGSPAGVIEFFPAHPHEGAVGIPEGETHAQVVATGQSEVTHRPFNLIVAFESSTDNHGNKLGRGIAESSFHHFADYNWDTDMGCPSFLEEAPGDGYKRNPQALNDIKTYSSNAARWLAQR
jgi:hypothetical protein